MTTVPKLLASVTLSVIVALLLVSGTPLTQGQQTKPKFLITWQAKSYVPPQYKGKVLPGAGSQIIASVELVDGGKLVDLSRQIIYWYANDNFVGGGEGVQTTSFNAGDNAPNTLSLRVQLPGYKNQNVLLIKTIEIPIAGPEVVIESPYPDGRFTNSPVQLKGIPYFFNVASQSDLGFTWSVNGETPPNAENPADLVVNINPDAPSGSTLNVGLTVQNPVNNSESASKIIGLTFIK
jgi:hypothetical protein